MRKISNIVLHCSDSAWGCSREIRGWHIKRGFSDIGYHFVVLNALPTFNHQKNMHRLPALDGAIECGRYLDDDGFISDVEAGAHALGYNGSSIGICLIGVMEFTTNQIFSLHRLLADLTTLYHVAPEKILGHCETKSGQSEGKTCPNLNMKKLRDDLATWKKVEALHAAMRKGAP